MKSLLTTSIRLFKGACFVIGIVSLAACQPTAEERLASATDYIGSAEYGAAIIELKNSLQLDPNNSTARASMAFASYQLADFPTAAEEYTRAIALGGNESSNWIGLGRSLLRMGDAVGALERVIPNLDELSDDAEELSLQGDVFAALGNVETASQLYQRAIVADSDSERGWIGLAIVAASRNNEREALKILRRVSALDDTSSLPHQILGNFLRVQGDIGGAMSAYQASIAKETPKTPSADRFDTLAALVTAAIDSHRLEVAESGLVTLRKIFPSHPLMNYLRGRIAFAKGDGNLAISELQEYLSKIPNDLRAHAVMGAVSFSQHYYSQAEMYLQQAVRGNAGGETTRRLLAETRLRLNRPQEALKLFGDADLDSASDPSSILELLGRAEFSAGNRGTGLEYLERAIAAAPDDPNIKITYAMALISDRRNDEAISALESLPEYADARHRRELLLIAAHEKSGDRKSAVKIATSLLSANPDDASAHALVGSFKQGIGEVDQAKAHFRDSLRLDPENTVSLMGIARVAQESGDGSVAESTLLALLDVKPDHMQALVMISRMLLQSDRAGQLAGRITAAIEAAPRAIGPRILQAQVALATDNVEGGLRHIQEAREVFPDEAAFRHLEGSALMRKGQIESALVALARAADDEPANSRYQFDLAVARLQSRDFFGANQAISRYRDLKPSEPTGLSVHISSLIGLNQYDRARRVIDEYDGAESDAALVSVLSGDVELASGNADNAIRLFSDAADTLWDRGLALRLSSAYLAVRSEKAAEPLARWLAEHPNDAVVRRSYGQILQSSGNRASAIAEYEKVLADNSNDVVALNNLAWEYAQGGRPEAVDLAKRAYDLMPEQGSIADTYGWILYQNGKTDEATMLLRKAARLAPENGEIQFHLATVLADSGQRTEAEKIVESLIASKIQFPSREEAIELAKSL